jgi:hypothetical protein
MAWEVCATNPEGSTDRPTDNRGSQSKAELNMELTWSEMEKY